MTEITQFIAQIEAEISAYKLPNEPKNLYDPLRYFFRLGGKRLRPVLTLMTATNFGAKGDNAIHAAMAIELFHNFSLIHDDIMDEAPYRRGHETVHKKWNEHIAILSGDVLLVKAYESLANCENKFLPTLLHLFNKTAKEVCEGQQMDMDFENRVSVTESEYIEMIRLKTSVLLGCSLQFGGVVSDLNQEMQDALYNYGQYIGIAFQIKDDLLDLYGDSSVIGKQIGGDVISNKKTLLSIKAQEFGCDLEELSLLSDINKRVNRAQNIFEELGAKKYVEQAMHSYYNKAIDALKILPLSQQDLYIQFASYLIERTY